jgi:hypothetical protein
LGKVIALTFIFPDGSHGRSGNAGPHINVVDDDPDAHVRNINPHALVRHESCNEPPPPRRPPVGPQRPRPPPGPPRRPPRCAPPRDGRGGGGGSRRRTPPGRRHRPPRAGGLRRAVQAATDKAGGDAGGRGQGPCQSEVARRGGALAVDDMPVRVAHALPQQHDRAQAHPAGLVGGGRGAGQEQAAGPRRPERAPGRREEAQADVDSRPREEESGGVLCGAAEAVGREDRRDRGETRPEEERGEGLVLQSEAEAEENEVRGATLTGC